MVNRSSSPNPAVFMVSSRTVAIAGATATLATAGALQALNAAPSYENYEGSIHLIGILPDSVPLATPSSAQRSEVGPSWISANIAPPDLVQSVQSTVTDDSTMATIVSSKLRKQGVTVTPTHLLSRLESRTSDQGWLELHYRDTDPQQVQHVLELVAQWYADQDSSCDIQACRDVPFIETQIPILQQQQQQIEQELAALGQHLYQAVSVHLGTTVEVESIEDFADHLLTQQHQQMRHLAHVETSINESLTNLYAYQDEMGLDRVKVQTGLALLNRIVPQYQQWLMSWKKGDRQLVELTLNPPIESQIGIQGSKIPTATDLTEESATVATESAVAALVQQQKALTDQMTDRLGAMAQQSLIEMHPILRELILKDVGRFGYVEDWLVTLHRLQLLDSRRQMLKQLQQDTIAETQEWQHAMRVRDQLQQELDATTDTLAKYQQRYVVAQHKMAKESLEWQVVSPPKVVQQTGPSSSTLSSLVQTANPLMTLHLP